MTALMGGRARLAMWPLIDLSALPTRRAQMRELNRITDVTGRGTPSVYAYLAQDEQGLAPALGATPAEDVTIGPLVVRP